MKFISWNVNGLRACMGKGWQEFFDAADADFFCLQETKLQEGQISLLEHEAARWVTRDQLDEVAWLPADLLLIPYLKQS